MALPQWQSIVVSLKSLSPTEELFKHSKARFTGLDVFQQKT
jgi:hypothetical protein